MYGARARSSTKAGGELYVAASSNTTPLRKYIVPNVAPHRVAAFSSIVRNTSVSSPDELPMMCSTSEVAASCSRASSRSRRRRSNCSDEWSVDPGPVGVLRVLGCAPWRCPFDDCPLVPDRRMTAIVAWLTTMLNPMQIPAFAPWQDWGCRYTQVHGLENFPSPTFPRRKISTKMQLHSLSSAST